MIVYDVKKILLISALLFVILLSSWTRNESLTITQTDDKNISVGYSSLFKIFHFKKSKDVNTGKIDAIIPHIKQKKFYPIFQNFREKLEKNELTDTTFRYKGYTVKMVVGEESGLEVRL